VGAMVKRSAAMFSQRQRIGHGALDPEKTTEFGWHFAIKAAIMWCVTAVCRLSVAMVVPGSGQCVGKRHRRWASPPRMILKKGFAFRVNRL